MQQTIVKTLILTFALLSWTSSAFVVVPSTKNGFLIASRLGAVPKSSEDNQSNNLITPSNVKAAAFSAFIATQPLVALAAEVVDDYEYGAVSAPPFVPIIGGLLAILTALLPIFLRSGEEAFEEMKGTDTFGKGQDVLKSRKK